MDEAVVKTSSGNVVEIDATGKKRKLPNAVKNEIDQGGKLLSAGDEEEEENTISDKGLDKHKGKGDLTVAKIRRTETEVEQNSQLKVLVKSYFDDRRNGNFSNARTTKEQIDKIIQDKNLDAPTVFYTAFINDNGDTEEEPVEEPIDEPTNDDEENPDEEEL
jgi:hypothetical protein